MLIIVCFYSCVIFPINYHLFYIVRFSLVEMTTVVMENVSFVVIQVELTQGGPTNRNITLNFVTSDINATGKYVTYYSIMLVLDQF